jgi:hypothetical protein
VKRGGDGNVKCIKDLANGIVRPFEKWQIQKEDHMGLLYGIRAR